MGREDSRKGESISRRGESLSRRVLESQSSPSSAPATANSVAAEVKIINENKALVVADVKKHENGRSERDDIISRLETEKRMALISAWEESEKTKAENKACRRLLEIDSKENCQKATVEAKIKKKAEKYEKKKADYAERMKNKMAMIHKKAEEDKAVVGLERSEDLLRTEEVATKYRMIGFVPKKMFGWFKIFESYQTRRMGRN